MPRIFDVYAAKIDGEHIKGSIRGALQNTAKTSDQTVCTISRHGFEHQSARSASAQRFHQSSRNSSRQIGIDTARRKTLCNAVFQPTHSA